jgi:4-hydroxythreonine-4-phosphate dehydrogenase
MRPVLAITMGDPAGVGPEITVKALSDASLYSRCRPLVIGSAAILKNAAQITGHGDMTVRAVASPGEALYVPGTIDVLDPGIDPAAEIQPGKVSAAAGEAAFQCVVKAIALAMDGQADATVTNPISKEAVNLAGHHFSGHTEIYAHYTGTKKYTMMLVHENLRVVHVSTHVSLREACDRVKKERVLDCIRIAHDTCRRLGVPNPRVGVAGLNPHCGEHGLFGTEDEAEIAPAVEAAKGEGIDATGPVPPDTVFSKARGGWFDVVVAMYHDQGHIPMKVVGFVYNREKQEWDEVAGVNITCGLPIIRTSVDHGTAMGHAGKGNASELSLVNAIDCAIHLAAYGRED